MVTLSIHIIPLGSAYLSQLCSFTPRFFIDIFILFFCKTPRATGLTWSVVILLKDFLEKTFLPVVMYKIVFLFFMHPTLNNQAFIKYILQFRYLRT